MCVLACVCMPITVHVHVEVKGQLVRVSSLYHMDGSGMEVRSAGLTPQPSCQPLITVLKIVGISFKNSWHLLS